MGLNTKVPPHVDPAYFFESQITNMFWVGFFMMAISAGSVAVRFWSRHMAGMLFWVDDWFALAAVPFNFTVIIINLYGTKLGWGRHTVVAGSTNPELISEWFRDLFIMVLFYNVAIAMFKCSFLALFVRIFGIRNYLRKVCIALGSLILLWLVIAEFLTVFRCTPISGQWKPEGAKCILSLHTWNIFMSSPTVLLAGITLAIPIPLVWQLKLRPAQRYGVMAVFGLGILDLIISILRMYYATQDHSTDLMWGNVDMYFWSVAEGTAGIMSCCFPTYAPLYHAFQRQSAPHQHATPKPSNQGSGASDRKYLKSSSTDTLTGKNDSYFSKSASSTGKQSSCHDDVELMQV